MSHKKGKFRTLFILLIQWHEFPAPKIDKSPYLYQSSPFERDIILKESLFDCTY